MNFLSNQRHTEDILKNPASSYQLTLKASSQIIPIYRFNSAKRIYPGDRFIPPRYNHNKEAARYLLMKRDSDTLKDHQLDVFKQVNSLSTTWKKKFMHQLMVEGNAIPGLRQKQVLRGNHLSSENKSPENFAEQSKDLWDEKCFEDGMWKSKPRKRPLIGTMESILDMPGFQTLPRYRCHLIDWSSRNLIAARIQDSVMFYDTHASQIVETLPNLNANNVCLLKWNSTGNKLAICTLSSEIRMYCVEKQKTIWARKCVSVTVFNSSCYIRCACWSQNDQHIVTLLGSFANVYGAARKTFLTPILLIGRGCKGLISIYLAKTGELVESVRVHTQSFLTLAFSKDYRYLASTALNTDVHIFLWPRIISFLNIYYYEPARTLAWHPHDSGCLCIGGGMGDASLLLWDVNKVDAVSYRLVKFDGAVENLAWNKRSGELVVHWSYWERQNRYTVMPVFASIDRIVDVLPVDKGMRVNTIMWNFDHTQLAVQSNESLTIYNFFGNQYQYQLKRKKQRKFREVRRTTTVTNFRDFRYFSIR